MIGQRPQIFPLRIELKTAPFLIGLILMLCGCGGGSSGPTNTSPDAAFTVSADSGNAPLLVVFDASGSSDIDGTISTYAWVFGDGATGNGASVQHTYQTAGIYAVQLTVTDDNGSTDTASRQIDVAASPPEAEFTLSTDNGTAPLTVSFNASGSSDADGTISSYAWAFGDGAAASGPDVQHTYATAGTYTAELTVTDNDGLTDTANQQITVEASPPEAEFTVSVDNGTAPLTVVFNATGSSDADGTISSYSWAFGDGATGSGPNVQHTYGTAGTYTAELTVTDNDGLTDAASHDIVISADPTTLSYTISGTVTSAKHMVTDSDVNDPNASYAGNNSFADAQLISAPVTVSGFVNVDNSGDFFSGDRFARQGDYDDYYHVPLTGGMTIVLYMVENPNYSELNLYLYNNLQTLVQGGATSTDSNGNASLTVPADGTYFIRVEAADYFPIQTATTYALNIGLTGIANTQDPLRLGDDFVPGEVLVRFESQAASAGFTSAVDSTRTSAPGFTTISGTFNRDKLLRPLEGVDRDAFFEKLGVRSALERSLGPGNMDSKTRAKMETLWMVRAMRRQAGVLCAEPNYIRKPMKTPNDVHYSYQWHYPLINLPEAWDITTGSSDVVVAVVDTGVLLDHPDLQGRLVTGYDFISDTDISLDGDGIDADPDDPGDDDVEGSSFHGTHVAGTIAASSNNGRGVAGIAWNTKIMPLRTLGFGGGTTYDIMEAVKYAAGLSNDSGTTPDEPADIINLSLGSEGATLYERLIFGQVREQGVIVIASAGNEGSSTEMYPAGYDDVVSVSAVTIKETLAPYSNYGDTIDVAAPGGSSTDTNGDGHMDGVLSTCGDDSNGTIEMTYAFAAGTSMAAPHVSGVVALMKALYPGMTPDEFDMLLESGYLTRDIGDSGRDDKFGWGLIDAQKAVLVADEGGVNGGIPAILAVSPGILNFGTSMTIAHVTLENGGGSVGLLTITGYSSNAAWLSVSPSGDVDAQGLGTYTVTVDRGTLLEGTYTGAVTFESNENEVTVSVVMRVVTGAETVDGGYHYILLLDPDTFETLDQADGPGDNGVYEYSFSGLSYGETFAVYAGTDPNNDGYICDDGEACGAFLSLDKPVELTVTSNMDGIDFTTDISLSLPTTATSRFADAALPLQRQVLKGVAE